MLSSKLLRCIRLKPLKAHFIVQHPLSSDNKKPPENKDEKSAKRFEKDEESNKKESAAEKLNRLLSGMKTDENIMLRKSINIPKAGGRKQKKQAEKEEIEQVKIEQKSQDIILAAKSVADLMGQDKKKTESELLAKLLNHIDETNPSEESVDLKREMANDLSLNELITRMKIEREGGNIKEETRADYVRKMIKRQKSGAPQTSRSRRTDFQHKGLSDSYPITGSVNLFGEGNLGIFTASDKLKESPDCLKTWEKLEKRELELSITHPPANFFEKAALWTEQGKLWRFPIDNEQGLDEEAKVDFSEHVFLEQHLEPWCPTKGPIRHFMELVCVGLSKNSYLKAQEKKEHILWYRDYFEEKKDILKEVIVQEKDEKKIEAN